MSRLIDRLRHRLASLFHGNRVEASLRSEIELHLQEQVDENIASGMSPADARRAALRMFGPVGVIEEQCRDTRRVAFVEQVAQDLRYTLRSLLRQPMLLAAAVVSIAVAVGANTTIFSLANELMFAMPSAAAPHRARAHSDGRRQPRLVSAVAATRGEPCAGSVDRLQRRGQRQLAGAGAEHQPEPHGRRRQFLRRHRSADESRARIHGGGGAGRTRSRGRRRQLRILAAPPGRRSQRAWQDAHVQRQALRGSRGSCRRCKVDGRVRAGARGLSADRSGGDA